jgi:hypothetical protein
MCQYALSPPFHSTVNLMLIQKTAYIPKIDNLFSNMFDLDPDVQKLLRVAPVPINEFKEEYKKKFLHVVGELKSFVLKQHKMLIDEDSAFRESIKLAKDNCNKYCISIIKQFNMQKKKVRDNCRVKCDMDARCAFFKTWYPD